VLTPISNSTSSIVVVAIAAIAPDMAIHVL
jgi:hypothetical protein